MKRGKKSLKDTHGIYYQKEVLKFASSIFAHARQVWTNGAHDGAFFLEKKNKNRILKIPKKLKKFLDADDVYT
jgi:hypothetical protein